MHKLSEWFTRNPVAANLLMMLILLMGYFTLSSMRIEGFPAIPVNSITITTYMAGADPEQIDRGISKKIEMALEGMDGLKKISTYSSDSYSQVWVKKTANYNIDKFHNEVKSRLDSIYNLPQNAEKPLITRDEFTIEAAIIQVYGNVDNRDLQKAARLVKDELMAESEISKIEIFGMLPYEIRVELNDERLRSFNLSLQDINQVISQYSFEFQRGKLNSPEGEMVIKSDNRAFYYNDFVKIPILTKSDGSRILLGDVATVIDDFSDENAFTRYQGLPSVGMLLYTSKKGHILDVSKAAHKVVKRLKKQLPENISVDLWGDAAVYMTSRLNLLKDNAWQGLLIVFALLAIFLNIKLAFWVAIGIPISIAGAISLMGGRFLDYSLNDITTFGLIIVLGILVDDAIVVGESVFHERSRIKDPIEGTILGVKKVSTATTFGYFTTVAAFYPLLLIDNDLGKLFGSFAVVVIVSLLVSLLESKLILPAHLARISIDRKSTKNKIVLIWRAIQSKAAKLLNYINIKIYQPLLKKALGNKIPIFIVFISIAIFGIGMIFNGKIRVVFFPEVPGQIITVDLKMISGSPLNLTTKNLKLIEEAAMEINSESMDKYNLNNPPIAKIMSILEDRNTIKFYAELQPEGLRKIETMETLDLWRDKVGTLEAIESLKFSGSFETGGGFILNFSANDQMILKEAIEEFVQFFSQITGVDNIYENINDGTPQIQLRLKDEAEHLGISKADLASQIGNAYGGLEVQRIQRGREELKVIIKYEKDRRRYVDDLLKTYILTSTGERVPLTAIATIETGLSPSMVHRQNGKRTEEVRANLDLDVLSSTEAFSIIKKQIEPLLLSKYPSLKIQGAGELEEIGEMQKGLIKSLILIFVLIYVLLAIPLKSYWQPFVIMSVIPFGFVGAVLGHKIMGFPLSVLSFFGMLAVMGIVVNDSLVMMTRYNELRLEGIEIKKALIQAGGSRFRPIFLTTVTTVCGLMPLLSETSEQAQYLIPAAISLAFGELFATPITLFLIPMSLSFAEGVLKSFKSIVHRLKTKELFS